MKQTTVVLSLVLSALCLILWARPADACGSYGPPTPRDRVEQAVWSAIAGDVRDEYVSYESFELDDERGVARVDVLAERDGSARHILLVFFEVDGRWQLIGRLDGAPPQSPSTVRKTL